MPIQWPQCGWARVTLIRAPCLPCCAVKSWTQINHFLESRWNGRANQSTCCSRIFLAIKKQTTGSQCGWISRKLPWEQSVSKASSIPYDPISATFSKWQNYSDGERMSLPEVRGGEMDEPLHKEFHCGDRNTCASRLWSSSFKSIYVTKFQRTARAHTHTRTHVRTH